MACGAEDCGPYQNNLFLISSHHPLWPLNSHPFWEASCADHRLRSIMLEGEEKPWNPNPSCITWRELFGGVCRGVCFKIWGGGRPRTQLWCWRLSRSCWWPSWYDGTRESMLAQEIVLFWAGNREKAHRDRGTWRQFLLPGHLNTSFKMISTSVTQYATIYLEWK